MPHIIRVDHDVYELVLEAANAIRTKTQRAAVPMNEGLRALLVEHGIELEPPVHDEDSECCKVGGELT